MVAIVVIVILGIVYFFTGFNWCRLKEPDWNERQKRKQMEREKLAKVRAKQDEYERRKLVEQSRITASNVRNNTVINDIVNAKNHGVHKRDEEFRKKLEDASIGTTNLYNYIIEEMKRKVMNSENDLQVVSNGITYKIISEKHNLCSWIEDDLDGCYDFRGYFYINDLVRMFEDSGALVRMSDHKDHKGVGFSYYIGRKNSNIKSRKRVR